MSEPEIVAHIADRTLGKKVNVVNKVFGSLLYESEMSNYRFDYQINDLAASIAKTEKL
jgi:UDP-glucose 4-epimerase